MSYYDPKEDITGPDPQDEACIECGEGIPAPGRLVCRSCMEDHRLDMAEME